MVAVLFARGDSIYKTMPGLDVYDKERDAKTFKGGAPVVAHPPCRAWSRMRAFAKPEPGEKELAHFAIFQVRENGGVLEHPSGSKLFKDFLPAPGCSDAFGWTMAVDQFWWGHKARKRTYLYIVGIEPGQLPVMPIVLGDAPYVCCRTSKNNKNRPEISKAWRERTPPDFAAWLVEVARRARI